MRKGKGKGKRFKHVIFSDSCLYKLLIYLCAVVAPLVFFNIFLLFIMRVKSLSWFTQQWQQV